MLVNCRPTCLMSLMGMRCGEELQNGRVTYLPLQLTLLVSSEIPLELSTSRLPFAARSSANSSRRVTEPLHPIALAVCVCGWLCTLPKRVDDFRHRKKEKNDLSPTKTQSTSP